MTLSKLLTTSGFPILCSMKREIKIDSSNLREITVRK